MANQTVRTSSVVRYIVAGWFKDHPRALAAYTGSLRLPRPVVARFYEYNDQIDLFTDDGCGPVVGSLDLGRIDDASVVDGGLWLDLAGGGDVLELKPDPPADVDGPPPRPSSPAVAWDWPASDDQTEEAIKFVAVIAGVPEADAGRFVLAMGQYFDGVPGVCVTMLRGLARYASNARARGATPEGDFAF